MKPLPDATVAEGGTALIKRHMANLLYPVDMSSLSGPESDTKFRDLIILLQQQMGVPPTGVLTVDQFDRLTEASRNIDGDLIRLQPLKIVSMSKDGSWVSAAGTGAVNNIGDPINSVRIFCFKERGACEMYDATYNQKDRFLFLSLYTEYQIDTWTPSRVTATNDMLCATALMTIDIKGEQVTIVTVPRPELITLHRRTNAARQSLHLEISRWISGRGEIKPGHDEQGARARLPTGKAANASTKIGQ